MEGFLSWLRICQFYWEKWELFAPDDVDWFVFVFCEKKATPASHKVFFGGPKKFCSKFY